jgi:hypothetical protein
MFFKKRIKSKEKNNQIEILKNISEMEMWANIQLRITKTGSNFDIFKASTKEILTKLRNQFRYTLISGISFISNDPICKLINSIKIINMPFALYLLLMMVLGLVTVMSIIQKLIVKNKRNNMIISPHNESIIHVINFPIIDTR